MHSQNHFHHNNLRYRNQRLLIKNQNHNKTNEEYFTRNYNNSHSIYRSNLRRNTKEEVPCYETKILLCYYFDITATILKFEGRKADKNALRMKVEFFLQK